MANFDACLSISICLHFWCNIRVGMFFWGDCSWIFVTDIIMGMGSGGTQRPRATHTLYHSSIKPTSRFYCYIYYIVSEYVFWPLLYFWHTVYACLWYSWWKWFMLASLVCNFNVCCTDYFVDSSQCEGHSGEKKKKHKHWVLANPVDVSGHCYPVYAVIFKSERCVFLYCACK